MVTDSESPSPQNPENPVEKKIAPKLTLQMVNTPSQKVKVENEMSPDHN